MTGVSYAYIHCKPDGTPFYVGKGVRSRYKNFSQRNEYHKRITAKYGVKNILIGKLECSTNDSALQLEIGLIKCLKRMGISLANFTDGGQGALGRPCSDKTKKAVVESNKQRVWSEEQKRKIGANNLGKKRPEHSALMKAKKHWSKEKNPSFGKGQEQAGSKNHMARSVVGWHQDKKSKHWSTLQEAANDLGVSIQAICQALKKQQRSKGWSLEYA